MYYLIRAVIRTRSLKTLWGSSISKDVSYQKTSKIIRSKLSGNIKLEENTTIVSSIITGDVEIGAYSYLSGPNINIHSCINKVKIGRFCSIARGVQIQEYNHPINKLSTSFLKKKLSHSNSIKEEIESKGEVIIGHDVWIGANAIILSGVKIGTGSIIAAGAVITKDVPPFAIVGGNPAKIIKFRFDDKVQNEIINSEWWNKKPKEILQLSSKYE